MAIIGIFTECYRPMLNGVVTSVVTYVEQLTRLGHEVYVFAPAHPRARHSEDHLYRFPSFKPPWGPLYPIALPWLAPRLKRQIERLPLDLIHTQHLFMMGRLGANIARRKGLPLCYTYHTLIENYTHYFPVPQRWAKRKARELSRDYCNQADCVIAPTSAIVAILRGYGVTTRIETIPTGIDLSLAEPLKLQPMRQGWGIPEGALVLLYAGRIAREKSMGLLLRAFALIHAHMPEVWFVLVGDGSMDQECRRLAEVLGIARRVHFAGPVPHEQVFSCAAATDLFVFASQTETQGLVIAEAMSVGLPCVAVEATGVREVVRHGENGLLTQPDERAFADAVLSLLRDPVRRATLSVKARETAYTFSAENSARKLAALYQELLGSKRVE